MTAAPPAAGAALELILRATVLIGAAWAAAAVLRKAGASAAARHAAWQLGIFAMLALPLVWWLAPPLRLPILQAEAAPALVSAPPFEAAMPLPETAPAWGLLLLAYLLGAAAVLLRFALSRYLIARLWRQADPAQEPDWQALLAALSGELGLSRPVQLRIARGPAMPMTWGTLAPRILLPAEARTWPAERRRLVLLHELAHVARRDSFGRSAASLACALYWFHPGAWFAARRLRLEQEHAADDRVLTAGARPKSYARSLLDLAFGADETGWSDQAAAMAGMCQLEQRVVSITGTARRERPGAAFHSAAAAITALTVLAVGAALPVQQPPALSDPLAIETALPPAGASSAPAGDASGPAAITADRAASANRIDARPRGRGVEAQPAAASARVPDIVREVEPPSIAAPAPARDTVLAEAVPPADRQLGPIGPQLPQPLPEELATDPRIPAALRRGSRVRGADQRAGPGPPRTPGEEVMRRLPTALLQAAGVLRN
ncbi:MAG TPA: M56 family metallopeptidase [Allosphingosinicella sp.]|nr:M56 family metallopeptidase [Allosphingosinicella sp.]